MPCVNVTVTAPSGQDGGSGEEPSPGEGIPTEYVALGLVGVGIGAYAFMRDRGN